MKQEETNYYKVVTTQIENRHKSYWSYLDIWLPVPFRVQYKVRKWATAPIGGLFVFDSIDEAKKWIVFDGASISSTEIWEVKVKNEVKLPYIKPRRITLSLTDMVTFWNTPTRNSKNNWPSKTRAFKEVMLWKRIPRNISHA